MERPHFNIPSSKTRTETVGKGGGGPNYFRDNYSLHGRKIYRDARQLSNSVKNTKDFEYSENVYTKIQSPSNISIKGIKSSLEHLGMHLTSIDPIDESKGVVSIKKNDLDELTTKIRDYYTNPKNPLKSYLKYIEKISPLTSEDKLHFELLTSSTDEIDIVLNLYGEVKEEKVDLLIGILKSDFTFDQICINKLILDDVFCAISICASAEKIVEISNKFNLIQSVDINPRTVITQSLASIEIDRDLTILYNKDNPSVVVIDSGVSVSGLLKDCIKTSVQSLPSGVRAPEYSHGTFVASRISFGDDLDIKITTGQIESFCNIIDVAVFGPINTPDGIKISGPNRFELSEILKNVVRNYKNESRVFNLSLGEEIPISDFSYSLPAFVIDYLSREFDVLFIIASGNIDKSLGNFPDIHFASELARICSPAESILALTVGSYSKYEDKNSLSRENQLSPFSRRGPGFNLGLKPELVHHGGNLVTNYASYARISVSGLFQSGNQLATNNGTSFSAPIVSQIAARLFKFYDDRSSNLIKALLVHFTDNISHHEVIDIKKEHQVGFGMPNFERAINAGKHTASYIYEGKVKNDEFTILKFHIPSIMASENPNSKLKIKVTIVSNPPVNFRDLANYAQSKVTIALDKIDSSLQKKRVSMTSDNKTESNWNPIQQIEKSFTRAYSTGEWELRVRCWTRGNLDKDFIQDFAVVIEIIDELNNGDPYKGIIDETGSAYISRTISIRKAA